MPKTKKKQLHLLPAFDEFLISYEDRTASLLSIHFKKAFSANGIFYPVIVANGKVIGLWKRTILKDAVIIAPDLFEKPDAALKLLIEKAAKVYGKFVGKPPQIIFP